MSDFDGLSIAEEIAQFRDQLRAKNERWLAEISASREGWRDLVERYGHEQATRDAEIERLRAALRNIAKHSTMSTKEAIVEYARDALSGKGES